MIKEVYITTFTIDIIIDGSRNVWIIRIIENSEDKKKCDNSNDVDDVSFHNIWTHHIPKAFFIIITL